MSNADDIVTRLRNIYTLGQLGVVHEAADEIERLRYELTQANNQMNDDIVTRLRGSWDCSCLYIKEHGLDRKCLHCEAADEIERLRTLLNNTLERENKDNARQLKIVRKVEADRDRWKKAAELMYEKANPKGAPICDCNVCEEYKYLAEGGSW